MDQFVIQGGTGLAGEVTTEVSDIGESVGIDRQHGVELAQKPREVRAGSSIDLADLVNAWKAHVAVDDGPACPLIIENESL